MSAPTGYAAPSAATMIEDEAREWRERLRERSAAALRRRSERAAAREEAARRRAHGLIDRRAARSARRQPARFEPVPFEPDLDCTE
jgi:hypothetical protein